MTKNASARSISWSIEVLKSPVDGIPIRYGIWNPEGETCFLLLNGRSEWIEKYADLPQQSMPHSCWASMDHRGQGESGGARFHVDSYDDYAQDVAAVAKAAFGDRPFSIIAHSMGGLIALYGCLKDYIHPEALFLSSPLLGLRTAIPAFAAKTIARCVSQTTWSKNAINKDDREKDFSKNALTSSFKGFGLVQRSPYPYLSPSFAWVHATYKAFEVLSDPVLLAKLDKPITITVGADERIVDSTVYGGWVDKVHSVSQAHVEWHRLPTGRHELLNETDRIRGLVIKQMTSWFAKHLRVPEAKL